jgi:hypothetical protein
MRNKVRDRLIVADAEKARLKLEAKQKYRQFPPMLQKPYESLYIISNMPIDIIEDEYFAGDLGNKGWGAASGTMWLMADIENTWPSRPTACITLRTTTRFTLIRSWLSPLRN